jgi:tRNA modification GTPase
VSTRSGATIVAAATPRGRSALAVVRLDGPRAREIATGLGVTADLEPRRATLSTLRTADGPLDEAIVTWFAAPGSYTGNDLVEFALHGSPFLADRLISAAVRLGAVPAEPGEFTERAVLNGKLDLVQAESVEELIAARTGLQSRVALSNLDGELSREALAIRSVLLDVISRFEGALDFADEGYEFIGREEAAALVAGALGRARRILGTYERGRATAEGIEAVILGKPNVGKSTLMNFLAGSERAIVTPIAGTTRDVVRETVAIGGIPVTLSDTAGLRETEDFVESIGVERAREAAERAAFIIYLVDATAGWTDDDRREVAAHRNVELFATKADLAPPPAGLPAVSFVTGEGTAELLRRLDRRVTEEFAPSEGAATIVNERQRLAVEELVEAAEAAGEGIAEGRSEELVLVDLYRAARGVGMLTGEITNDEILDSIFAKFCIGK